MWLTTWCGEKKKRKKSDTHKNCEGVNRIRAERTWQKWELVGMRWISFIVFFFLLVFDAAHRSHNDDDDDEIRIRKQKRGRERVKCPSKYVRFLMDLSSRKTEKYFNFKLQATYEIHTGQHKYSRSLQQTDYYYICFQHFDELWNYIAAVK